MALYMLPTRLLLSSRLTTVEDMLFYFFNCLLCPSTLSRSRQNDESDVGSGVNCKQDKKLSYRRETALRPV